MLGVEELGQTHAARVPFKQVSSKPPAANHTRR
jgi:hypothetical protein